MTYLQINMRSNTLIIISIFIILILLHSCERGLNGGSTISLEVKTSDDKESTKGSVADIAKIQTDRFRVSAYHCATDWATNETSTTPNIMANQEVIWDAPNWTYSPIKYWPPSGKVSFFACSPKSYTMSTSTGLPKISFTTNLAPVDQIDLLTSQQIDKSNSMVAVNLNFKHTLSCIRITAKKHDDCAVNSIIVTNLEIIYDNTVARSGEYTFPNTDSGIGSWSVSENFNTNLNYSLYNDAIGKTLSSTSVQLNDNDKYLMLIPQTLSAGALTLSITYSVDGRARTRTLQIPKTGTFALAQGKIYTFALTLTADIIEYDSPIVKDWPLLSDATTNIITETTQTISTDQIANCYIVNRGVGAFDYIGATSTTIFRFPAIHRVNQFWGGETSGGMTGDGGNIYQVPLEPAYKDGDGYIALGNSDVNSIGKSEEWYAQVIWSDIQDINSKIVITQTSANKGIGLEYLEITFKPGLYSGNIIIGVTQGELYSNMMAGIPPSLQNRLKYLWFWHLWVTNYDPDSQYIMMNVAAKNPSVPYPVMDRNLGAKDEFGDGLYYQWGRKDPFYLAESVFPNSYSGDGATGIDYITTTSSALSTLLDCVYRPNLFFKGTVGVITDPIQSGSLSGTTGYNRWGGNESRNSTNITKNPKTIYDPCPPGWRMPWGANWSGVDAAYFIWNNSPTNYRGRFFTGISEANTSNVNLFRAAGMTTDAYARTNYNAAGYYWGGSSQVYYQGNGLFLSGGTLQPTSLRSRIEAHNIRCVKQ